MEVQEQGANSWDPSLQGLGFSLGLVSSWHFPHRYLVWCFLQPASVAPALGQSTESCHTWWPLSASTYFHERNLGL